MNTHLLKLSPKEFCAATNALSAQVAELERDKARIEFLANHPESMPYLEDGIWRIPYLGGVSSYHRTLSGCIDAAMNRKTK
jgi:hypothetical protein